MNENGEMEMENGELTIVIIVHSNVSSVGSSSKLLCDAGSVLKIVGLIPLGPDMRPLPITMTMDVMSTCKRLTSVEDAVRQQCSGRQECIVDLQLLQLTRDRCQSVAYLSVDCYCQELEDAFKSEELYSRNKTKKKNKKKKWRERKHNRNRMYLAEQLFKESEKLERNDGKKFNTHRRINEKLKKNSDGGRKHFQIKQKILESNEAMRTSHQKPSLSKKTKSMNYPSMRTSKGQSDNFTDESMASDAIKINFREDYRFVGANVGRSDNRVQRHLAHKKSARHRKPKTSFRKRVKNRRRNESRAYKKIARKTKLVRDKHWNHNPQHRVEQKRNNRYKQTRIDRFAERKQTALRRKVFDDDVRLRKREDDVAIKRNSNERYRSTDNKMFRGSKNRFLKTKIDDNELKERNFRSRPYRSNVRNRISKYVDVESMTKEGRKRRLRGRDQSAIIKRYLSKSHEEGDKKRRNLRPLSQKNGRSKGAARKMNVRPKHKNNNKHNHRQMTRNGMSKRKRISPLRRKGIEMDVREKVDYFDDHEDAVKRNPGGRNGDTEKKRQATLLKTAIAGSPASILNTETSTRQRSRIVSHLGRRLGTINPKKLYKRQKSYDLADMERLKTTEASADESRTNRDFNSSPEDLVEVYRLVDKRDDKTLFYDDGGYPAEKIPQMEAAGYFCDGGRCGLTVKKTLGLPVVDLEEADDILAVIRTGISNEDHDDDDDVSRVKSVYRQQIGEGVLCNRIRQQHGYSKELENWKVCHMRGPLPQKIMDMIKNNFFVVVAGNRDESENQMIIVQKDDHGTTQEIVDRILKGSTNRKDIGGLNGVVGKEKASGACRAGGSECHNNGTCVLAADKKTYSCSCRFGYYGTHCTKKLTKCDSRTSSCLNGGTCVEAENNVHCLCPSRFTGPNCETRQVVHCSAKPCLHLQASCVDTSDGFQCNCPPGRTGDGCEFDARSCRAANAPCKNSGLCLPLTEGGYVCLCDAYHYGRHCGSEFANCIRRNVCKNGGTCVARLSKKSGVDRYHCVCTPGHRGELCQTRVDPCVAHPCQNGAICQMADTPLGFICICGRGFQGTRCETAVVLPPAKTLLVEDGKKGTCSNDTCTNGGDCFVSTEGENVCVCRQGFGGLRCENSEDSCSSNPCLNGGSCYNMGNGELKCTCLVGFQGNNCQRALSACTAATCQNGGVCRTSKVASGSVCICPEGFGGISCDIRDVCLSHPCQNGAPCQIFPDGLKFQCNCPAGFSGKFCEHRNATVVLLNELNELNPCSSVPCLNRGTCRETVDHKSFVCICQPGVKGKLCETDAKNECKSLPCLNGGVCRNLPGGFKCSCPYGLEGVTCEKKLFVDPCDQKPCQNGGVCKMRSETAFDCLCPVLFSGPNCTIRRSPCQQSINPCRKGKSCAENPSSFHQSYICVDRKIQNNPSGNVSWKFISADQTQILQPIISEKSRESAKNKMNTAADAASSKRSNLGPVEIIVISCVATIVFIGICFTLAVCRETRVSADDDDRGRTYRETESDDSWENLLSYRERSPSPTEIKPDVFADNNNNTVPWEPQRRTLHTIPEEDAEVLEERDRNFNNSAGDSWKREDRIVSGPRVFLIQPESVDRGLVVDVRSRIGGSTGNDLIPDACRYAALDRLYGEIYRTPQMLLTPPKRLVRGPDDDEDGFFEKGKKRKTRFRRHPSVSDGYLSVDLVPYFPSTPSLDGD